MRDEIATEIYTDRVGVRADTSGRSNSCFVIGGITDVSAKEFSEHIELINAILYLLEFRYGIDSKTALRDAERDLDKVRVEDRARMCYEVDQMHVAKSKFIVAILNSASTGTGQELERAAALNIPILALVKAPAKTKLGRNKTYIIRHNDRRVEKREIHVSDGELSIMVAGNPSIMKIIKYDQDRVYGFGRIKHAFEKIGWMMRGVGAGWIGGMMIRIAGELHSNCSLALKKIDDALQKEFGLVSRSSDIEARIETLEKKKDENGHGAQIEKQICMLKDRKRLLDDLLIYNPLRLNHELEKYNMFRIRADRGAHMFTKKYSTKKIAR